MVLGLPQSTGDFAAVGVTAKLAELLRIDLCATFVEDEALTNLAALPFVRELRPLGGGWRPIEVKQLAREFARAAEAARHCFHEAVRTCRIEAKFDLARGEVAEIIASVAQSDDIIVIIEPGNPAERVTQQFIRLRNAALKSDAAVLFIPNRVARTAGPVVAFAMNSDDPSIRSALTIAAAAKERMIAVGPLGRDAHVAIAGLARTAGVGVEPGAFVQEPIAAPGLATSLSLLNARLLVMSRDGLEATLPAALASLRGIPVLVVEPDKAAETKEKPDR
jgi:hypothetical protein